MVMRMDRVRIIFEFPDRASARAWLFRLRELGLESPKALVEDEQPLNVKRNGPKLARWLMTHEGWHPIADAANRSAARKAAYKINNGIRRGFETGAFEARARYEAGAWIVEARVRPRRQQVAETTADMHPLF